jgi:hypothetical protein
VQLQDQDLGFRVQKIVQVLNSWGAHGPTRLQNLVMKVQREMESQLQHHRSTWFWLTHVDLIGKGYKLRRTAATESLEMDLSREHNQS